MIKSFKELEKTLKNSKRKETVVVVAAHDKEPLIGISKAVKKGLCRGILVGDEKKIRTILKKEGIAPKIFKVINAVEVVEIVKKSIDTIKSGEGTILMKGLIATPTFMEGVLSSTAGLKKGKLLSHSFVFENPFSRKFTIVTDGGLIPFPSYEQKIEILENGIEVAKSFGIKKIKIAMISASEKITQNIPSTVDFDKIKKNIISRRDIIVEGPFGIDVAISKKSASHKEIKSKVSGNSDIWLVPSVEAGNMMSKAIQYFTKARSGGIIIGAMVPIVLLSRADDAKTKFNSILLGLIIARRQNEK